MNGLLTFLRQKKHAVILLFILVFAVTLRFYHLGARSFWFDDSYVVLEASKTLSEVLSARAEGIHPPLFRIILHSIIAARNTAGIPTALVSVDASVSSGIGSALSPAGFGLCAENAAGTNALRGQVSEWIFRLPSACFSLISVLLIYLLARVLSGRNIALLVTGMMSISAFHIYYAQEIKMYALFEALSLASGLFLICALRSGKRLFWAGYVLFNVLVLYTHYFAFFLLAGQAVFVLIYSCRRINRELIKDWLASLFLTAVFFLPWVMNMLKHFLRVNDNFWLSPLSWRQFIGAFKNFFFGYYTGPGWFFMGNIDVFIVCLLGAACLLRQCGAKERNQSWDPMDSAAFILCGAFIPVLGVLALSFIFRPIFFDRPFIFVTGFYYLFFACGLRLIWRRKRLIALLLLAVFLAVSLFSLRNYYLEEYFVASPGIVQRKPFREMCAYITRNYLPGDAVALSHLSLVYPLICYLPEQISRKTYLLDYPIEDKYEKSTLLGMMETSGVKITSWRRISGSCDGLWVISGGWNEEFVVLPQDMREWLAKQKLVRENFGFKGIRVYYYRLRL